MMLSRSTTVYVMLTLYYTGVTRRTDAMTVKSDIVMISRDEQKKLLDKVLRECYLKMTQDPHTLTGLGCNRTWDTVMCWPDVPADTVAKQPCPTYVHGSNIRAFATRECMADGTWFVHPLYNRTWTNYSACSLSPLPDLPTHTVSQLIVDHIPRIELMYKIGYGLSLVSLILAVFIMIYFKKLHCPRNTLHVNLFLSFILRASMSFLKDNLLVNGLGFPSDMIYNDLGHPQFNENGTHWQCKVFMATFHLVLSINYMWIFIEALYLHMLIFVSVFSENSSIRWYLAFGWLSPLIFVVPWAIVRATLEDIYCWTYNPTPGFLWIVKGPISVTVVVNFIFFLNIVRVLFTKMNASNRPETNLYGRLTRSTLVLIPLFGVHYIVFLWMPNDLNPQAELVKLYFEMFFTSFQGFLVAVLFCFLNTEVRTEVRKTWERYRMRRDPGWSRAPVHNWNTLSSYVTRTRCSIHSLTERDHCASSSGRVIKNTSPELSNGTALHTVSGRVKNEDRRNGNETVHLMSGIPEVRGQQDGGPVSETEPMMMTTQT